MKSGKIITPEAERDFKLISLVLSMEYYFFLLVGLLTVSASTRKHLTILSSQFSEQLNFLHAIPGVVCPNHLTRVCSVFNKNVHRWVKFKKARIAHDHFYDVQLVVSGLHFCQIHVLLRLVNYMKNKDKF